MSRIVFVHGIAQETVGPESLLAEWYPALCDGLVLAGGEKPARDEVAMAFYGDLFRQAGHRGIGSPELDASDVEDGIERELLLQWWEYAARLDPRVSGPGDRTRARTPHPVQRALEALSHSAFFAGVGERLMIGAARQVRRYFTEPQTRAAVRERFERALGDRTEVVVAHSLGSVVAYEALCARPDRPDVTLVTLGSPLGVRNLVFDRLLPPPHAGRARWPAPVRRWVNIADRGDLVALAKELGPLFGDRVRDVPIHNGAKAHDVRPYLTARESGEAIGAALAGRSS
ncbi:alpha/beta hydrolase [Streptomyces sp. NBC_00091]|uniref:alpha/beta hydrolase n=1 Tax=Streptomyces sp. NBC_00091 TaxID=2975648 RepID=UPI00225147BB|nr:alpha/beta hydrolase [Streptomyces sp. NBC_00091]MCX5379801.1 alpha/beta hydrolase [Streptomyces sp. NBC_00091]